MQEHATLMRLFVAADVSCSSSSMRLHASRIFAAPDPARVTGRRSALRLQLVGWRRAHTFDASV